MAGTWVRRGRAPAAAVLLAALAVPMGAVAPAVARDCTDLAAAATTTGGRTQVLLSLPSALTGVALAATDVSLVQDGLDLPVLSVADVPATATDVVVVVDSSSASAPAADGVRAATAALLQGLAAPTRVAVLSTGDAPTVVQPLVRGPRAALPALADLAPHGANDLVDTLLAGIRLLPAVPGRQQQVVVVAAGADSGSASSWGAARELLVRRGVALDVVDLGASPSLPRAGAQCPGTVEAAGAAGAARTLAQQLQDRRLVLVPDPDRHQPGPGLGHSRRCHRVDRSDDARRRRRRFGARALGGPWRGRCRDAGPRLPRRDPRAARPAARGRGPLGARRCGAGSACASCATRGDRGCPRRRPSGAAPTRAST